MWIITCKKYMKLRAGHALFFRLHACALALLGEALRAGAFALFFGLKFRAPALLDFSRSFFVLLNFSRFFSRSSIFRARTFALIDFHALIIFI